MTIAKQEWLKQMEGILEILNEGVGITDDTGHVLFVNECMERLLGAPRSALIGKTAIALYSGEDYEFTLARRARIKDVGYDGRRSAGRWKEQLHGDISGAAFPVSHAGQGAQQRHGGGCVGVERPCP